MFLDSGFSFEKRLKPPTADAGVAFAVYYYFYRFSFCSVDNILTSSSACFSGWKQQLSDTLAVSRWINTGLYMNPVHYGPPFKTGCISSFEPKRLKSSLF